jgi:CheY-like chemotaxis protein
MRQRTVLLVNETAASESLTQALLHQGFIVISALDEREAFSKFEANKIDLILLDLDLGQKRGWGPFERLADRVPVIVIRATQSRALDSALFSLLPSVRASREQAFQIPLSLSETCSAQFRQTPGNSPAIGMAKR